MANTIILKKSSVAGKVPLSGDLTFGEIALNYADGKIYYKNTATNIDFIGNGGTFTNTLSITNTTQSVSTTTGALTVSGGVGIGGQLNVGGTTSTFAGNLSIGTTYNGSQLVVAAQTSTNIASALTGTNVHIIGANSSNNRITVDSFGGYSGFSGRSARGTANAPSAIQANDLITQFTARGYGATGYGVDPTAIIGFYASENFTDSAKGTYLKFKTTPAGTTTAIDRLTIEDTGELIISHLGATNSLALNNPILIATSDANGFVQINMQNKSTGISASADYVVTTDDGDDTTNYIDLGINNSGYSNAGWTVSGARDGYLYVAGNNLTLGTDTTGKEVRIHVGGTLAADVVAIFRDPGTVSTSDITGSFNVDGGAGITGDVYVGQTLHIGLNPLNLPNSLILGTGDLDDYVQVSLQNKNNGPNASADFVITADDGDDISRYINLGLNNSGYIDAGWTISGPRDGYLFVANNSLTLGTDSIGTTVKVHVGGTTASNIVATFNEADTQATSTTTGALVVSGGVGISKDLRVGGTVYSNGTALLNFNTSTLVLQAVSATTATSAATAYSTIGTHTAGTGLSGSTFNGSANQTWTLNTATLMASAVSATTATNAATAYSLANTGTTYVSRAVLADSATTATNAATAYALANTATTFVGRAVIATSATNLIGGAAGSIPYQSAANTTVFVPIGTSTFVLQSNGGVPTWVSTSSLGISGGGGGGGPAFNGGTITTALIINSSTQATSTDSGALQVINGGAGIGGNLYVGGNIVAGSTLTFTPANANFQYGGNRAGFLQAAIQNASNNSTATTDFTAFTDNGNDLGGYIDFGITSSAYADPLYDLSGPGDGFLYVVGTGTNVGKLTISTYQPQDIVFSTGGGDTIHEAGRWKHNQGLVVTTTTTSISTTTGALVVNGGAGIAGSLAIGRGIWLAGTTGTNGQVITSNGTGGATWQTPSGGPGGGSAPVFTFGGTGTPIAATDVTPYILVRSAVTSSVLSLTAKTPPTTSFSVSILRSSDDGATFPTTIGTVTLTAGDKVTTTVVTTVLAIGDILRCDILSVNGAADWNCQLETV